MGSELSRIAALVSRGVGWPTDELISKL